MEQLAQRKKKIVIGVSGASGTIYAINLVKKLKEYPMIETHGIISPWAKQNLKLESDLSLTEFESLFDYHYSNKDLGAAVASGSFLTDGMIIVPASMKTVAGISVGLGDNLIARAADVTMKEQRKPQTIQDLVNHHTMKLLDQFGIVNEHSKRWQGD